MEKGDFQKELAHFDEVEEIIRNKLKKLREDKILLREQVLHERKEMWEDNRHLVRDFDDVIFLNTQETVVKSVEKQWEWNEIEIQRHIKMQKTPYFGRVDFVEGETGEAETIYIGIHSLTEEDSREIYVVDWRAPISSMFYQFDSGPAWYQVHDYRNEVEITGKRQYKIEEGRLISVYDTDSSMYDDILGDVLSKHSDHKLKVIIGSIQKEQNTLTAVSISELKDIIEFLSNGLNIPYLGIKGSTVTDAISKEYDIPKGVYIKEAVADSPAMTAGLQTGDVIAAVNKKEILTMKDYQKALMKLKKGDEARITVNRQNADGYKKFNCTLEVGVLR